MDEAASGPAEPAKEERRGMRRTVATPSGIELSQRTLNNEPLTLGGNSEGGALTILGFTGGSADAMVDFEVKPALISFDGGGLRTQPAGEEHVAEVSHDLADGAYRWRARVRDSGAETDWHVFAAQAATHFVVVPARVRPKPSEAHDGPGSSATIGSAGGVPATPNPSRMDSLASLWSLLIRATIALCAISIAAVALVLWRTRSARGSS
jgi:hypothetical protein